MDSTPNTVTFPDGSVARTVTDYTIKFQGKVDESFDGSVGVEGLKRYIDKGVEMGQKREDYEIVTRRRTVTTTPWTPVEKTTAPIRYAVAFVTEKDQPVNRPMWVAKNPRANVDFGSYVGHSYMVTDDIEQAATFAKRETAERWVERLTSTSDITGVLYGFEVAEVADQKAGA